MKKYREGGDDGDGYSLAEYMAMEEGAEYKSEFYDGDVYAMAGGSPNHSAITANCIHALASALSEGCCQVYDSNLMVKVEPLNAVLYPDASVICGPLDLDPEVSLLVKNPTLVVEVLSASTSRYDHGDKFFKYQMIPSLTAYVMVEQTKPRVYVALKASDGAWHVGNYFGLDSVIELPSLGVSITMEQIYKRIQF